VCLPLAKRPDVRSVIGDAAEMIAFANCVMDRASFDGLIGAFNCVVRDSFLFCYCCSIDVLRTAIRSDPMRH
jgi:hypothetical protein